MRTQLDPQGIPVNRVHALTLEAELSAEFSKRAWREAHPDGKVLSAETGYPRDYGENAYASYEHSRETMFPVKWSRPELPQLSTS